MPRKHRSPEERARLVVAFRRSGLSQAQFAAREGITISALQSWLYKPRKNVAAASPDAAGFLRVVGAERRLRGEVTIHVGEHMAIAFDVAPEPGYLAALARALAC